MANNINTPDYDISLDTIISAEPGTYNLTISNYSVIPAVKNLTDPNPDSDKNTSHLIDPALPADYIIRQSYILIETSNPLINIRLYSKRVPYFMNSINRQYNYSLNSLTLRQILEHLRTHPFTTQLTYSPKYGAQYDFH